MGIAASSVEHGRSGKFHDVDQARVAEIQWLEHFRSIRPEALATINARILELSTPIK